jgi:TonB family protein
MRKFPLILLIFLLLISYQNNSAQEKSVTQEKPKLVSCDGCRKPKIIYLALPKYSNEAKKINASGKVEVEILIDEKGKVKTAKAISGHPLLRIEAVRAALKSKFEPYKLSGKFVRTRGKIIYFFTI